MTSAGDATNVVTDYVYLKGEARSHDSKFIKVIRQQYQEAFAFAANQVFDDQKKKPESNSTFAQDYFPLSSKITKMLLRKHLRHPRPWVMIPF